MQWPLHLVNNTIHNITLTTAKIFACGLKTSTSSHEGNSRQHQHHQTDEETRIRGRIKSNRLRRFWPNNTRHHHRSERPHRQEISHRSRGTFSRDTAGLNLIPYDHDTLSLVAVAPKLAAVTIPAAALPVLAIDLTWREGVVAFGGVPLAPITM